MKIRNFLYLCQLEEYDMDRIKKWINDNPNNEVEEIKGRLIWTIKIKALYLIACIFFFTPSSFSVLLGLKLLQPVDNLLKFFIVLLTTIKLCIFHPNLKTIAITGSWGKTTAKEILQKFVASEYISFSNSGNQNTLLGICQNILRMPINTEIFICEIGAYYPEDIDKVCKLINPKIGIITAIGLMHLERFGSIENIRKTKMELSEWIPLNGLLFLPNDQKKFRKKFKLKTKNVFFFKDIKEVYLRLSKLLKIDSAVTNKVLSSPVSLEHRQQVIKNGTVTIIDDSYNSNPVGFEMALNKIKKISSTNRILITPGMIELGQYQYLENLRLAKMAGKICHHIIVVGKTNYRSFKNGLKKVKSKIYFVNSFFEAQQLLPSIISAKCVVLIENDLPDNYF